MDFDRQLRYFQLQHDRMPEGRFWIPLADLLLRHGRIPDARALLEEGLRVWPASVSGRWLLARCLEADGDLDGAREAVAAVLAHDPGHLAARALQESLAPRTAEEPTASAAEAEPVAEAGPDETPASETPASETPAPPAETGREPHPVEAPEAPARPRLTVVPDLAAPLPEDAFAEEEEQAPAAEAEPVDAAEPAPGFRMADDPAPTFVTRTLADIYLEQGHREKALQILRQVLAVHPERDDITARIRSIESGAEIAADAPVADPDQDQDNRRRFDAWLRREAGAGE